MSHKYSNYATLNLKLEYTLRNWKVFLCACAIRHPFTWCFDVMTSSESPPLIVVSIVLPERIKQFCRGIKNLVTQSNTWCVTVGLSRSNRMAPYLNRVRFLALTRFYRLSSTWLAGKAKSAVPPIDCLLSKPGMRARLVDGNAMADSVSRYGDSTA